MTKITITSLDQGDHGEYRAVVEGHSQVGRLLWVAREGKRVAEHTLVPPEIGGRGVAGWLVEALVADAQAHGFQIVPECSYVAAAFKRHPEWAELRG